MIAAAAHSRLAAEHPILGAALVVGFIVATVVAFGVGAYLQDR